MTTRNVEVPPQDTEASGIPSFGRPYDWSLIDESVRTRGAVIACGLVDSSIVDRFNTELDWWLEEQPRNLSPDSGSELYDLFLGLRTIRLHGLLTKVETAWKLILDEEIVSWARRMLGYWCNGILLNAAELMQIGPRELPQVLHRDTGAWWPHLPRGEHPLDVNALLAMSHFTLETGATRVVLDSCQWPLDWRPRPGQAVRAVMEPGDGLLIRGDVMHGGGANRTHDQHRRGLGLSYCAGWLRPMENHFLSVPPQVAAEFSDELLALLGYTTHDATPVKGGLVGMYDNGDPLIALRQGRFAES